MVERAGSSFGPEAHAGQDRVDLPAPQGLQRPRQQEVVLEAVAAPAAGHDLGFEVAQVQ